MGKAIPNPLKTSLELCPEPFAVGRSLKGLCKRQSCTVTGSWICLHPRPVLLSLWVDVFRGSHSSHRWRL